MNPEVENYLDDILNQGLEKDYWFITKQTMSDFFFIFTIAKIVKEYKVKKKPSESFGSFYSRYFLEDDYLKKAYPKQWESENTFRNAIIAEFFGLFYREKAAYDSSNTTPAFDILEKYISKPNDVIKYRFIIDRQIEKLALNVNDKVQNYNFLSNVTIFPVMFLYKILFELKKRTGDSTLYYDEFVVFLCRAKSYSSWPKVVDMILSNRTTPLAEEYKRKYDTIANDVTAKNIRFDALFGTLANIEYAVRQERNYYKIKDSNESIRYIENALEIYEHSKYASENIAKNEIRDFMRSDKYFIGNLEVMFVGDRKEETKGDIINDLDYCDRLHCGTNIIIYGVPGAGKSHTIKTEYLDKKTKTERVVFHPDYTYSDFVGQILPKSVNGNVTYEFVPGPFTKIVRDAYRNPSEKFILIIEEINRGNAPAIFGDIFQLLDRDERAKIYDETSKTYVENPNYKASEYGISNADVAKIVYENESHEVKLPSNLAIICTMNTSDQNVFTLDTAFQRRWNMRLIDNSFKKDTEEEKIFAETHILDTDVSWENFCETINAQILEKNQNMTSSEDKRLGTHFVNQDDLYFDADAIDLTKDGSIRKQAELRNRRFPEKVIKYLWDDAFKFYRDEIFKGEFNSLEKVISEFTSKLKNDRFNIFKDNIKGALMEIANKSEKKE